MMRRRQFVSLCAGAVTATLTSAVSAHTPFNQWQVYRRKHLLIGCHKDAPPTYELAKKLVAALEHDLPGASARVARAPDARRIASLMGTDQLDTAVLGPADALQVMSGKGAYVAYGTIDLRLLYQFDQHVLVGLADMPDRHAWLIHDALDRSHRHIAGQLHAVQSEPRQETAQTGIDWHPGARMSRRGKSLPDA